MLPLISLGELQKAFKLRDKPVSKYPNCKPIIINKVTGIPTRVTLEKLVLFKNGFSSLEFSYLNRLITFKIKLLRYVNSVSKSQNYFRSNPFPGKIRGKDAQVFTVFPIKHLRTNGYCRNNEQSI